MGNMLHIQRVSRAFRFLFLGWFICTPIGYGVFWLGINHVPVSFIRHDFPIPGSLLPLSFSLRCAALAISLLPMCVQLSGLWTLIRLFTLYGQGSIFTVRHVKYFRRLGYILLLWTGAGILYRALIGIVLSWVASPGQVTLSLGLTSTNLTAFIIGGIVLVIAWIMDEGRKLADEQALFV